MFCLGTIMAFYFGMYMGIRSWFEPVPGSSGLFMWFGVGMLMVGACILDSDYRGRGRRRNYSGSYGGSYGESSKRKKNIGGKKSSGFGFEDLPKGYHFKNDDTTRYYSNSGKFKGISHSKGKGEKTYHDSNLKFKSHSFDRGGGEITHYDEKSKYVGTSFRKGKETG